LGSGGLNHSGIFFSFTLDVDVTGNALSNLNGAGTAYGIYESKSTGSHDPGSVRNNSFDVGLLGGGGYYFDNNATTVTNLNPATVTTAEGTQTLGFWGNTN
jgi:hypothetical protein